MPHVQNNIELLYDLLHVHKDCSAKCAELMEANAVQSEEFKIAQQLSRLGDGCLYELRLHANPLPNGPAEAVMIEGDIYKGWQEMVANTVPTCCEKYIAAINNCYENALEKCKDLPTEIKLVLLHQSKQINAILRNLRSAKMEFAS